MLKKIIVGVFALLVLGVIAVAVFNKKPVVVPVVEKPDTTIPKYKVIGTSLEGRKIESYTYGSGPRHIAFVGGMHGGYEWNSVLLAYQFMDYLKMYPETVPASTTITVIPTANPDGVYKVTGKEGRFLISDVSTSTTVLASGRFNARNVDLNRNFGCKWQPKATWQSRVTSAGAAAFSEPEAQTIKNFVTETSPDAVVFWHSAAGSVYASECEAGVLPGTLSLMNAYSRGSGYTPVKTFDAYEVTGDAEGWLASINIPAVTVELKTHTSVEFDRNLAGIKAVLQSER